MSGFVWEAVQSSNIMALGFEDGVGAYVKFLNGGIYLYEGVDHFTYNAVSTSESVGKAVNRLFKGKYKCTKLDSDPANGVSPLPRTARRMTEAEMFDGLEDLSMDDDLRSLLDF